MARITNHPDHEVPEKETCMVYFSQEEKQVRVPRGVSLLMAAEKAGIYSHDRCLATCTP